MGEGNRQLSLRQLNLIEYMLAHPSMSEYACAKECDVPHSTYRGWKAKGDFTKELNRRLEEQWEEGRRLAIDQMQELAKQGNFSANKYILDNLGYGATQKIKAEVEQSTTINVKIGDGE